jgi:putative membrane protein insertion efficiency factor
MRAVVLGLIRAYQLLISPLLPPACRFYPSCSQYAATAVRDHGIARGGWLAISRLARCHPWHPGGVDFVPAAAPRGARRLGSR